MGSVALESAALELRPLTRADRDLVASFFSGLSPRTLYERFCGPKPRLTARDVDVLTDIDGREHVALGLFTVGGEPVALGRFVRGASDDRSAEVALTVADAWQDRGLGSLLARRLAQRALHAGLTRFRATVLSDNERALAVLRKLGRLSVVDYAGPALEVDVPLVQPGAATVAAPNS